MSKTIESNQKQHTEPVTFLDSEQLMSSVDVDLIRWAQVERLKVHSDSSAPTTFLAFGSFDDQCWFRVQVLRTRAENVYFLNYCDHSLTLKEVIPYSIYGESTGCSRYRCERHDHYIMVGWVEAGLRRMRGNH